MDFADTINQLSVRMEGSDLRIKGLVGFPDLTGFYRQETNMKMLPVEFVKQSGDGDYGFHGEIYFPTAYPNGDGGVLYLHIEFDA
jgi:hypothetical protein